MHIQDEVHSPMYDKIFTLNLIKPLNLEEYVKLCHKDTTS